MLASAFPENPRSISDWLDSARFAGALCRLAKDNDNKKAIRDALKSQGFELKARFPSWFPWNTYSIVRTSEPALWENIVAI